MNKGKFIIICEIPKGYTNCCLDNPIFEIKSLDPSLRILENITCLLTNKNVIEVFINNEIQYEKLINYVKLRKLCYIFCKEDQQLNNNIFDYSKSRQVGHILFQILMMVRSKHPELKQISKEGFSIMVNTQYEYKNNEIISMKKNNHTYAYSKGIDDELFFEEDGWVIEEYSSVTKTWGKLRNPYVAYEVGTKSFEWSMKYTQGKKPLKFEELQ